MLPSAAQSQETGLGVTPPPAKGSVWERTLAFVSVYMDASEQGRIGPFPVSCQDTMASGRFFSFIPSCLENILLLGELLAKHIYILNPIYKKFLLS